MNPSKIWSVALAFTALNSSAFAADAKPPTTAVPFPSDWSSSYFGRYDLYSKARPTAPASGPSDWSGFYVGIEGGYGWGHETLNSASDSFGTSGAGNITTIATAPLLPPTGSLPQFKAPDFGALHSADQQGGLVGGFAGAQKQRGNWVVGVEADVNGADIKGPPISYELNQIGTSHPNRR
jgi:hypothetical protein